MKDYALSFSFIFILLFIFSGDCPAAGEAKPELLPDLVLKVPGNPQHKKYLGLTGQEGSDFTIKDIKADILLIELFNMYCPYCQKEAPKVNELYNRTREISRKGPVVRIIGLGVSNTVYEVDHFRKTYNVSFPLFPDKDMKAYTALSAEGTPAFIGCRLRAGQPPAIILRQTGGFGDSGRFLQELIDRAGPSR